MNKESGFLQILGIDEFKIISFDNIEYIKVEVVVPIFSSNINEMVDISIYHKHGSPDIGYLPEHEYQKIRNWIDNPAENMKIYTFDMLQIILREEKEKNETANCPESEMEANT
jgi:hypothetical protein